AMGMRELSPVQPVRSPAWGLAPGVEVPGGYGRDAVASSAQLQAGRGSVTLDDLERQAVEEALRTVPGDLAEVARRLGISRTTLWRKMKRWGLAAAHDPVLRKDVSSPQTHDVS
ncbi:MAG: helix-turn-helix domain-containing protein, partial [Alicyclobacillus sp.]|nr:helix-turn-helix domain-containing protein [Alicyclobacillus sp.]